MSKQTFKQFDNKDSGISEINAKANETMQKMKFQDQKKQFDAKIEELATQAANFYTNYGEEDWRTSLLVNFLDMSLQMKDIIEVITAFNVANDIMFNAMNLMNTSLNMSNGMMIEMANSQKTNPIKQKILMYKAILGNRRTVKRMINQMKTSIQMASITAGMYADLSVSISGIMDKMNMKREKKNSKKKATPASTASAGRGLNMVRDMVSGNQASAASSSSSAPTTPPPSAAPSNTSAKGGDSGLDGLL